MRDNRLSDHIVSSIRRIQKFQAIIFLSNLPDSHRMACTIGYNQSGFIHTDKSDVPFIDGSVLLILLLFS